MDRERIRSILEALASGGLEVDEAMERLRHFPIADLGFARLDTHRGLRQGFPEVVFAAGKTVEQLTRIVARLREQEQPILLTRVDPAAQQPLREQFPELTWNPLARTLSWRPDERIDGAGLILIITAGTSDIPVAEEAAVTARLMGNRVESLYDVGVAGIHRILDQRERILSANVLIVVAGMEGALPSVIGGLVARPVIAVPTSVGYGTSFGGLTALLGMLNSCAANVLVTNIDNGFGAGFVASLINHGPQPTSAGQPPAQGER
jgi:hypothetical protein